MCNDPTAPLTHFGQSHKTHTLVPPPCAALPVRQRLERAGSRRTHGALSPALRTRRPPPVERRRQQRRRRRQQRRQRRCRAFLPPHYPNGITPASPRRPPSLVSVESSIIPDDGVVARLFAGKSSTSERRRNKRPDSRRRGWDLARTSGLGPPQHGGWKDMWVTKAMRLVHRIFGRKRARFCASNVLVWPRWNSTQKVNLPVTDRGKV